MEHAIPVERKAIKPKNATVKRILVVMTLPGTKTKVVATEDVEVSEVEVVVVAVEAVDVEEEEVEVNVISPESNVFIVIRRATMQGNAQTRCTATTVKRMKATQQLTALSQQLRIHRQQQILQNLKLPK